MDRPNRPFTYRLEHHDGTSVVVLERTTSFATAASLVPSWAERLRARGADGSLLVVEEAFGTAVARHPLWPAGGAFDPGHGASLAES